MFAQLYVGGVHYGVHAFLVPLRCQETHKILPGVRIKDCGHKMGLNGIDNGWQTTPRVRLSVLDPGHVDIVDRAEEDFPLPRPTRPRN